MINFQKIYGLYGVEHHMVEINGHAMGTDERKTSEYSATQSMDSVRLCFRNEETKVK